MANVEKASESEKNRNFKLAKKKKGRKRERKKVWKNESLTNKRFFEYIERQKIEE